MKTASAATQSIIESGYYLKFELWQITLLNGSNYYFNAGDSGGSLTVSGHAYVPGLIFIRDQIQQRLGANISSLDLTVSPQFDVSGGQPQIAGGNFLSQCRAGVLDGAVWKMSKAFFVNPSGGGGLINTTPGLVPWWSGITSKIVCGRSAADITLDEATALLNVMMPRNMIQAGCVHTFCDAGCTLLKSNNTYTGTVSTIPTVNSITVSLLASSYADHYFDHGIITFTSGVLNGASFAVQSSGHVSTAVLLTTSMQFPTAPSALDSFSILAGCDKSFTMCGSGKFKLNTGSFGSNQIHYRGAPFVPNPETLYDGGTGSQTYASIGRQGQPGAGSPFTGRIGR